jgi:hypothetical protein
VKYPPRCSPVPTALSRSSLIAVALVTAAMLSAAVSAGAASGASTSTATMCRSYQHITVTGSSGTQFLVKNDNYGGHGECLTNLGGGPNFRVARSSLPTFNKKVQAYPFIVLGCSWGTCSPGSSLPRKLSVLSRPAATWQTSQNAKGTWNASFDLWFGKQRMTTGQANGELMIWLSARNRTVPARTRVVTVDQVRWYLLHTRACYNGTCWNSVQFRRVRPALGVKNLQLSPFITRAEAHGWIKPSWWLENIEAGFEIWQGGTGLATDSFSARA